MRTIIKSLFVLPLCAMLLSSNSTNAQEIRDGKNSVTLQGGIISPYDEGVGATFGISYERELLKWLGLEFAYRYEFQNAYPSGMGGIFSKYNIQTVPVSYIPTLPWYKSHWSVYALNLNFYPLNKNHSKITLGMGGGAAICTVKELYYRGNGADNLNLSIVNQEFTPYVSFNLEYEYTFNPGITLGVGSRLNIIGFQDFLPSPVITVGYRF